MAETGDLINEFKQAKPPEKVVIVVGIFAVAGVAWYLYKKGQAQSAVTSSNTGAPTSQTAGYPAVGANGTPVLPSGVNPVYDPNGNLVAFQNPPPPGSTPPPATFSWPAALSGMKIWQGTTTHQYFFGPNGPQPGRANQTLLSSLFPQGTVFGGGTGGHLTYTLPGSTTPVSTPIILANPVPRTSMITSNTIVANTAGGGTH